MNDLARLSAAQRQQMIDEFVDATFAGTDPDAPGAGIANAMRTLPTELPDDPSTDQVEAWIELGELVSDPSFRARVREMAVAGAATAGEQQQDVDAGAILEHAGAAMAAGVDPAAPGAREVLDRIVPPGTDAAARTELADRIATFTDPRVERYWRLIGTLNGWDPFPSSVPAHLWLVDA